MRKLWCKAVAWVWMCPLIFVGCAASDTAGDDRAIIGAQNENATELTFWTFNGLHVTFFEDAVDRWNEENPDRPIKLVAETYPYDQMHNNLLMSFQSGTGAPDIVDIEIKRFSNYLQGEIQLVPLNDAIEPVKDKFVQARLDIYAKDGKYYGLPTHVGATVMYYNTDILKDAGVDLNDIVTWEDYVEAGKKVVEATGKPMTTIETGDVFTFWPMISQQGSDFFDRSGNVTVDNETNVQTLEFIVDMVDTHHIAIRAPGGNHHAEEYYGFMNQGGAASVLMPMWYMGRFTDYMPDLEGKIAIRPMPSWEPGGFRSAGMGGTATSVTTQSDHQQLAVDFLAFAKASERGNIKLWELMGFDPPRFDVWDFPDIQRDNKYYDYFGRDIFTILSEVKDEIHPVNIDPKTPEAIDLFNTNVFYNVLDRRNQTPEEALHEVAESLR